MAFPSRYEADRLDSVDPTALPTDNLYKFLALAGLMLAGFCAWLEYKMRESHSLATARLREQAAVLRTRLDGTAARNERGQKETMQLRATLSEYQSRPDKVTHQEVADLSAAQAEQERMVKGLTAERDAFAVEIAVTEANISAQEAWLRRHRPLLWALQITIITGLLLSCIGFDLWYRNVQWYADKQTKADYEDHMAELAVKRAARAKVKP